MLAFEDRGAGPALVLLHGIGSDHRRWDPVVERLAGAFRCIAVDLPGHGASPDEGMSVMGAAAAVQDLIASLELDPVVVVGHSLGANVALMHAGLHAPRAAVSVDPVPLHLPDLAASLAGIASGLTGRDFAKAFLAWEQVKGMSRVPGSDVISPRQETVLSYWEVLLRPGGAGEVQPAFEGVLRAIAVPVLVCLAEPPSAADEAILAGMGTAEVQLFDGLGHFLHLEDPGRFCRVLRDWLEAPPS